METGRHAPRPNTLKSIKRALEAAEREFVDR
jgi:hypothetical protein